MAPTVSVDALLQEIFATNTVIDGNGIRHVLHSSVGPEKGQFLRNIVANYDIRSALEIGCAFGISSMYISDALRARDDSHHVIIDPGQSSIWHNVGLNHLRRAGLSRFEIIELGSEAALPLLLAEDRRFDFAFVDGLHRFENVIVDFFYVNQLLRVGGLVVFDDLDTPAVNRALRYILNFPHYEVVEVWPSNDTSTRKRRALDAISGILREIATVSSRRLARQLLSDSVFRPKRKLLLDRAIIALRKSAPDTRHWNWFEDF